MTGVPFALRMIKACPEVRAWYVRRKSYVTAKQCAITAVTTVVRTASPIQRAWPSQSVSTAHTAPIASATRVDGKGRRRCNHHM